MLKSVWFWIFAMFIGFFAFLAIADKKIEPKKQTGIVLQCVGVDYVYYVVKSDDGIRWKCSSDDSCIVVNDRVEFTSGRITKRLSD